MSDLTEEKKLLEAQLRDQTKAMQGVKDRLEAIARKEAADRLEPLKKTAARAHDLLCPYNHTDGCSWGYEGDSWNGSAHHSWLRKIDTLVNGDGYTKAKTNLTEINILLDMIEEVKPKVPTALDLIRTGLRA